ncbi:phosphate/phosphite/phosphonate ABC transporter substrate-binding protein [Pararhizobium sp.]|uniref:phosphate/phosphite/phosphonate ABC transporter substrate-binding protein n=1 Tax=Pararhizobium sp. TaxID=1977563 RepID=UPI002716A34A|nr:PhnD/SsuA/transferrin family substrate-binding protein [Pararhizobium sp.]MDO9418408.1 PhnD/SsuA/transferrin family substrate-binding protein [Pararhizobium sp.]
MRSYSAAGLPMYDWPEIRSATDHFWGAIRVALLKHGIDAPDVIDHSKNRESLWQNPDMLLAQTCGLPYVRTLKDKVRLVGTPSYSIDCAPGHYYSAIVVRTDDPIASLADFSGTIAVNELTSQSGYGALMHTLSGIHGTTAPALSVKLTGSHRHSIRMVASGEAGLAAIDAISFELAKHYMPEAAKLRVLTVTAPTPGLPLITALPEIDVERLRESVAEAIDLVDAPSRAALLITGIVPISDDAYAAIGSRWNEAQAFIRAAGLPGGETPGA